MRSDRPLIASIVFLATGLSLVFGYCSGATSLNAAYPLAASVLHLDITTSGPAALGGIAFVGVGLMLAHLGVAGRHRRPNRPSSRQFQGKRIGQDYVLPRGFSSRFNQVRD